MRRCRALVFATCAFTVATGLAYPGLAAAEDADHPVATQSSDPAGDATQATDVTNVPPSPATTDREVVVVRDVDGEPQVEVLRADSPAQAAQIATRMNSEPGVSASVNEVFRVPETQTRRMAATASTQAGRSATGRMAIPRIRAKSGAWKTARARNYTSRQWNLRAVRARAAWRDTRGKRAVVAVIDTGVDATHPDLRGRLLKQINVVNDGRTGDVMGHGTHVAGIIAADLNRIGTAGVANRATILPIRVFTKKGYATAGSVAEGIIRAVRRGATVINMSLGSDSPSRALESAVAYATRHDVSVVAAAGNAAQSGNPVSYPAAFPGVLAVASIGPSGRWSWWSNYGEYVDLTAPGERILSTVPGARYASMDGTSMAAPHVAAAAALIRSKNPTLTTAEVEEILAETALDDTTGNGWDEFFGYGLVRTHAAVAATRRSR